MKLFTILAIVLLSFGAINAQQNDIVLKTKYGSDNKEIHGLLRFQEVEVMDLNFTGLNLKGKDYRLLIKEFTNGVLSKTDTIINSKSQSFLKPIAKDSFQFKFYVQKQLNNKVKMQSHFNRFSNTKLFDVLPSEDKYALHDFGNNKKFVIEQGKPTYIMVYFLPYLEKGTGWKKYCDVSESKHKPENWGTVFNIPSYFLVEVLFD